MRQFVKVKFHPWDRRTYTYHNDGPAVQTGDKVIVMTGRGSQEVEVDSVTLDVPDFQTKRIEGSAPGKGTADG